MNQARRDILRLFGAGTASGMLAVAASGASYAAPAARDLTWKELVPANPNSPVSKATPSGLVQHGQMSLPDRGPAALYERAPGDTPGDGSLRALQPSGLDVVEELNGTRVRMRGFVVPLSFEGTRVKDFLLVPYVGACIHVPPPPANQIVFIEAGTPVEIAGIFEAVAVTGTMRTEAMSNEIASFGYQIVAEQIERLTATR